MHLSACNVECKSPKTVQKGDRKDCPCIPIEIEIANVLVEKWSSRSQQELQYVSSGAVHEDEMHCRT